MGKDRHISSNWISEAPAVVSQRQQEEQSGMKRWPAQRRSQLTETVTGSRRSNVAVWDAGCHVAMFSPHLISPHPVHRNSSTPSAFLHLSLFPVNSLPHQQFKIYKLLITVRFNLMCTCWSSVQTVICLRYKTAETQSQDRPQKRQASTKRQMVTKRQGQTDKNKGTDRQRDKQGQTGTHRQGQRDRQWDVSNLVFYTQSAIAVISGRKTKGQTGTKRRAEKATDNPLTLWSDWSRGSDDGGGGGGGDGRADRGGRSHPRCQSWWWWCCGRGRACLGWRWSAESPRGDSPASARVPCPSLHSHATAPQCPATPSGGVCSPSHASSRAKAASTSLPCWDGYNPHTDHALCPVNHEGGGGGERECAHTKGQGANKIESKSAWIFFLYNIWHLIWSGTVKSNNVP